MKAITLTVLLLLALNAQVSAQSSQIQGPRDNSQVFSGVVYGPIDQNDTLWRIASRYKQDAQFSVYQVMLAIYELNPQAFENGNFNTMVNGATLRLPSDRYIARTDVQQGRAKAEQDDRLFGRRNSVQAPNADANSPSAPSNDAVPESSANLKPDVPLVNQQDLSNTQNQLQNQLNGLRRQQQQQFEALKNQVSASINSVEILLDENRKLSEQLLQIDENNRKLTQTVETELQVQIDQQVTQLNQLIDRVKDAEQRRIDDESKSILALLSSNTAIILISSALTLIVLIGFFIFLLRRSPANNAAEKDATKPGKDSGDIVDDELVIGELDDEIDQDSDDLLAALELDTASQDDDILSDDLEDDDAIDAFSEDELGADFDIDDGDLAAGLDADMDLDADSAGETDDFGDMDDDMLVPDASENKKASASEENIEEHDFDAISLDDDDALEGISLDEDENKSTPEQTASVEEIELGLDDDQDTDQAVDVSEFDPDSIENPFEAEEEEDDGTPDGVDLDENGEVDEDTLDQIERQIKEKDKTINQLADELLEDIDSAQNADSGEAVAAASAEEQNNTVDELDIDALLDEVDEESDDNLQALAAQDTAAEEADIAQDDASGLSDELLAELEADSEVQDELDQLLEGDDLSALDSLEGAESDVNKPESVEPEPVASDIDDAINMDQLDELIEEPDDQVSALADELLQELESEDEAIDELDSLLDELDSDENLNESLSEDLPADASEDITEELTESPNEAPTQTLSNDSELNSVGESNSQAVETDEDDELSSALNSSNLDADDLLDDIPSFTSEITDDEEPNDLPDPLPDSQAEEADPLLSPDNEESIASEVKNTTKDEAETHAASIAEPEEEQDVLSSLPDLDDWLDEPDISSEDSSSIVDDDKSLLNESGASADGDSDIGSDIDLSALELDDAELEATFDEQVLSSDEDDLIKGLDDANFDDMLNELSDSSATDLPADSDIEQQASSQTEQERPSTEASSAQPDSTNGDGDDQLKQAGLDLEALMTEEHKSDNPGSQVLDDENDNTPVIDNDFVDVDDLLKESDAMPEMQDSDLDLDLENSLDQFVSSSKNDDSVDHSIVSDEENDQASNLDLAQVYIDMEDFEAAQELLDEVKRKGTEQQISEADTLIASYAKT